MSFRNVSFLVFIIVLLSACAGPRYTSSPVVFKEAKSTPQVEIVRDDATREGFLLAVESWLNENNYEYVVVDDGSKHDSAKLTIEYVGYWGWDLALYLKEAKIDAYHEGQKIGEVGFRVPYTANFDKFGNGEQRIKLMMDVLFGKLTAEEARQQL